jgi:hypothetical protein
MEALTIFFMGVSFRGRRPLVLVRSERCGWAVGEISDRSSSTTPVFGPHRKVPPSKRQRYRKIARRIERTTECFHKKRKISARLH